MQSFASSGKRWSDTWAALVGAVMILILFCASGPAAGQGTRVPTGSMNAGRIYLRTAKSWSRAAMGKDWRRRNCTTP
jgi:hypothetical protein